MIPNEVVKLLEDSIADGFDVHKIAKAAFEIYFFQGRDLSPKIDTALLKLIAMSEGPEFELDESEFEEVVKSINRLG